MAQAAQTAIVSISSHVVRGAVGNRATVFALESLGYPVWSVPTIVLPWHPGHGPASRIVTDEASFDSVLGDLSGSKFAGEVRAVISGYMGCAEQVLRTAEFVSDLRNNSGHVLYVCDPVIGDEGGLYVSEEIATAIREHLVPLADLITPNRFEYEWLQAARYQTNRELTEAVRTSNVPRALITSAFAMLKDGTGNLYIDKHNALLAEHRIVQSAPNGTGDLMAALFTGRFMAQRDAEKALVGSTQSVAEILQRTFKRGADELTLSLDQECLRRPNAAVQLRQIMDSIQIKPRSKTD